MFLYLLPLPQCSNSAPVITTTERMDAVPILPNKKYIQLYTDHLLVGKTGTRDITRLCMEKEGHWPIGGRIVQALVD